MPPLIGGRYEYDSPMPPTACKAAQHIRAQRRAHVANRYWPKGSAPWHEAHRVSDQRDRSLGENTAFCQPCSRTGSQVMMPPIRFSLGQRIVQTTKTGGCYGYTLTAADPYLTKAGAPSAVLTWAGTCAVCGEVFSATSGRKPRELVRTCLSHRGMHRYSRKAVAHA